ncbi:MAG TPA: hypothetical protein GXX18_02600 [Bacillales bacterium]|nr:hypothetical protein [Bacillales bacterium]
MKENVWQEHQHKLGILVERSVSLLEIYQNLLIQHVAISEEVEDAIERNDYVKLSHLLVNRSKIQSAIKEVESLHVDELNSPDSMNGRICKALKDAAATMESKGEDMLSNVINNLDKFNQTAGNMVTRAISISNKTLSKGNQLNHRAVQLLIR